MKNLRKINIIIAALLCAAVSVMAAIVSNIKIGGANSENPVVSAATALFDAGGNYAVNSSQITKGAKFDMYNNTWTVVAVNGTTATLWADNPVGGTTFNTDLIRNNTQSVHNTFNPAYLQGTWRDSNLGYSNANGTSNLRLRLLELASSWGLNSNPNVLDGMRANNISANTTSWIGVGNAQGVSRIYYNTANGTLESKGTGTISLNWNIGSTDKLWVPSREELQLWNVNRAYSDSYEMAWLRDANIRANEPGGHTYDKTETNNLYVWTVTKSGSFADEYVYKTAGIRPAMNLDISSAVKYTVTWRSWEVLTSTYRVLGTTTVSHGSIASYPNSTLPTCQAPTGYMYTFDGWSATGLGGAKVNLSLYPIRANTTFTALYLGPVPISGTITWVDGDGNILETDTHVAYGASPSYDGTTPTKTSSSQYDYTFNNTWSPAITPFQGGNITYTAQFSSTVHRYTITWDENNGSPLYTETLEYGATPSHANPIKAGDAHYTYTFDRWSPAISSVTKDEIYTAVYRQTVNEYKIIWKNGEITLRTEMVNYGATPTYTDTPTLEQSGKYLDFIGWRIAGTNAVYDATATSTFAETNVTTGAHNFEITEILAFGIITDSVIFEAVYTTENVHTVLWMGPANDSILQVLDRTIMFYERVDYSSTATFRAAVPRKQWFAFSGWSIGTNGNNPSTAMGLAVPTPVPTSITGDDVESNYMAPYYATITGDTILYACFEETKPDVVTPPNPIATLKYDGSNQIIINYGQGRNGVMEYTFGSASEAGQNWQSDRLRAKDVGTYYVWYQVAGARDTTPVCVTVTIAPKSVNASEVTVASIPDQEFDRKGVNPQPIVMDKDGVIVTGEWVWENNKAVGTATGTFQPNGNFTIIGSVEEIKAQFNIVDSDAPSLQTQLLKIAFVSLCVIGIISIICVAVVCSRHRIEESENGITE